MVEQGSPEWHAMRCGKVTASRIADMLARTKSGWGASRATYAAQLVSERLTGVVAETYNNVAMEWGRAKEAEARAAYCFCTNRDVAMVDFVAHPMIPMSGASPDGFVGHDGLLEIKCPNTATHIATLLDDKVPDKYVLQMLWQMECTGRSWCDFVSFDPRMPEDMRLWVRRVERDDNRLRDVRQEVLTFLDEVEATVSGLLTRYRPAQQAAE